MSVGLWRWSRPGACSRGSAGRCRRCPAGPEAGHAGAGLVPDRTPGPTDPSRRTAGRSGPGRGHLSCSRPLMGRSCRRIATAARMLFARAGGRARPANMPASLRQGVDVRTPGLSAPRHMGIGFARELDEIDEQPGAYHVADEDLEVDFDGKEIAVDEPQRDAVGEGIAEAAGQ